VTTPLRPSIALTLGDPAGIGPELAVRLLAEPANLRRAAVRVLASADEVAAAAETAGVQVPLADRPVPGVAVLDDDGTPAERVVPGEVSEAAGARALHQLRRAVELARTGRVGGIVFAPLNKTSLHMAGMQEQDELRWFARELDHTGTTSELNVLDGLWTARVTSHVSIAEVSEGVTAAGVLAAIELLHGVLRDSGVEAPRLGVAALNPHNGENGLFGRHEIDEIGPGVRAAQERGIDARGPMPCDTIFLARDRFDGIVTMYHDQGQIAMKLLGFDGGVTVQGGLPVLVATPAHGTAFDLVGTGRASLTSTQNAFDLAVAVASRRADAATSAGR
jgi:4-hydroxy-L-threonine phosphate dehydrogenase PdxA